MIFEPEGLSGEVDPAESLRPAPPRKTLTMHLGRLMFLIAEVGRLVVRTYYLPREAPVSTDLLLRGLFIYIHKNIYIFN